MEFCVYIIFSESLEKFYIGYSSNFQERLSYHNDIQRNLIWTKRGIPWTPSLIIPCKSESQAIRIERHIKKMKSKKYIRHLIQFTELQQNLTDKYQ